VVLTWICQIFQSSGSGYIQKKATKRLFQVESCSVFVALNSECQCFLHLLFLTSLGATRPVYALEPHDVGRYLQAEIDVGGEIAVAKTAGPVDPGLFD